mgnify:CR=1 FL=1
MSFDSAFETFGISGIVLFGLCSLTYKIHQNFIFSIASHDFLNKYNPQKTLWEIWENGNSINSGIPNDHWNKYNYGKKVEHEGKEIWEINIPSIENGNMYMYRGTTDLPIGLYDGKYYFRIKIKNLKSHTSVFFQQKRYYGTNEQHIQSKYKYIVDQEIINDGVHYFEPKCCIGEVEGDGEEQYKITKEQIGIYIKSSDGNSIKNLIIEEAYIGKKCWKINLLPYISDQYYLIVEPKKVESK